MGLVRRRLLWPSAAARDGYMAEAVGSILEDPSAKIAQSDEVKGSMWLKCLPSAGVELNSQRAMHSRVWSGRGP